VEQIAPALGEVARVGQIDDQFFSDVLVNSKLVFLNERGF
jgi:hypothetical protein